MKFLKTIGILAMLVTFACSSDSDNDGEAENGNVTGLEGISETVSNQDSFTYKFNNETISVSSWTAVRSENTIAVTGIASDGSAISAEFNVFGDLGTITASPADFDTESTRNFQYFKSNYFNFTLLGVDTSSKRVEVKFSGKLYENEYDLTSNTNTVEARFNVQYREVQPAVVGSGVTATINGEKWYDTTTDTFGGLAGSPYSYNHYSDDAYRISYVLIPESVEPGVYQFSQNTEFNKISFAKYDTVANTFNDYETVGVFEIEEIIRGFGITRIVAKYSLTAVRGNETIIVKDGVINSAFFQ